MIRVIHVEKPKALFCHYARQTSAQSCYIELDCREGTLLATYDAEIGNAIPFTVYYGHEKRFGIPCLTNDAVNQLMDSLVPLAERVVAGYDSYWDGHNMVARFNGDAQAALEEISDCCECCDMEMDGIVEWDVEDWLNNVIQRTDSDGKSCKWDSCVKTVIQDVGEITGITTDEELFDMEKKIEGDLEDNMVLTGVSKFLEEERDNCKNNTDI
jgi:hypothetical protein